MRGMQGGFRADGQGRQGANVDANSFVVRDDRLYWRTCQMTGIVASVVHFHVSSSLYSCFRHSTFLHIVGTFSFIRGPQLLPFVSRTTSWHTI